MTLDVDKAFEVTSGLVVNDRANGNTVEGPFYTGGPNSPIGLNLPNRTIYTQTKDNGLIVWRKYGNEPEDWAVHDGLLRTEPENDDIRIPVGSVHQLFNKEINCELYVDGEVYVV